nr:phosphotransferase [uncultured Metabacillus sp.]
MSLYPFMEGAIPEKTKATRNAAAEMLAKLHVAAQRFPSEKQNPGHTSVRHLNWNHNHMWNWEKLKRQLEKHAHLLFTSHNDHPSQHDNITKLITMRKEIERQKEEISQWIVQLSNTNPELLFAPTHGDYYRGNILCINDQISAVIDWDECRPDWLVYELARATWEFCKDKKQNTLNREWAIDFVQVYKNAGGPIPANELQLLIPFIRSVRMIEILFYLDQGFQGEPWDPEYTLHNLYSLINLTTYQDLF